MADGYSPEDVIRDRERFPDAFLFQKQNTANGVCILTLKCIQYQEPRESMALSTLEVVEREDRCKDGYRCPERPERRSTFSTPLAFPEDEVIQRAIACEIDWNFWARKVRD